MDCFIKLKERNKIQINVDSIGLCKIIVFYSFEDEKKDKSN